MRAWPLDKLKINWSFQLNIFISHDINKFQFGILSKISRSLRGIEFGIIGGLVGTVLMDIVMMLTFVIAGEPAETFFTLVGEKFGYGTIVGIFVHNLVGITGGFGFSLMVLNVHAFRITSMRRGMLLGLGAGAVTIPLGCIPLAIWLDQPILVVISFSLLPHLVWGVVVGWMVAYGTIGGKNQSDQDSQITK